MIIDRGCLERGCACYDERDEDGVEVVKREWVGLTDEEVFYLAEYLDCCKASIRNAEAKLKEKNT